MKKTKIITALALSVSLLISSILPVHAESANENEIDAAFEESIAFMSALKILGTTAQKENVSLVTRAEFAAWVLNILGVTEQSSFTSENNSKFTGYTNDPEFDKNGDWIWKDGIDDTVEVDLTEFHDVASSHPLYDEIRLIINSGYMSSQDGYFRPDEPIKGYEVIKVAVELCGAKALANGKYPEGYYQQAINMKLTKNVYAIGDYPISYRDISIILYNTLHTKTWEIAYSSGGKYSITRSQDIIVLDNIRGIKHIDGTLTKNSITGIYSANGASDSYIEIDDVKYYCKSTDYDQYLGYKVNAYYNEDGGDRNLIFALPSNSNSTLTVYADDDTKYESPYLYYTKGTSSRKKVYIGAETNIIYNGVLITEYDDSIFAISDSSHIDLLDSDNDGKYETVFINQVQYMKVSAVDTDEGIIYNGLSYGEMSLKAESEATQIYDMRFNPMSIENIVKDTIISYQKTLPTQNISNLKIICSTGVISGMVERLNSSEKKITVDGTEYNVVSGFNYSTISVGNTYTFYLTADNRLIESKSQNVLQYGYLMHIRQNRRDDTYSARIYDVESQEIVKLNVSERVKINKKRQKLQSFTDNTYIFSAGSSDCIPQIVKYKVDESGNLAEILTANFDKDLFTLEEINKPGDNDYYGNWTTYKSGGGFFAIDKPGASRPVAYSQAGTRFVNLPLNDLDNEKAYFRITYADNEMGGHRYPDYICKSGKDSAFVELLVDFSDIAANGAIAETERLLMVEKVVQMVKNEEICYFFNVFTAGGTMQGELYDTDLFPVAAQIKRGDIIRWEKGGKLQEIVKIEKVFDGKTKKMISNNSTHGTSFVNSSLYYFHGRVENITDNGTMIWAKPYTYEYDGTDFVYGFNGTEEPIMLNASKYSVYVFDGYTAHKAFYDTDIFSSKATSNGSQIVTDSVYGAPRCIFIYK